MRFDLYLNNKLAGKLMIDENQRMSFNYVKSYTDQYSLPVSYSMPVSTDSSHIFSDDTVFPFIENLLPEESIRSKIQNRNSVNDGDIRRFIELMAGDMAGAITITIERSRENRSNENPLSITELSNIILDTNSSPFNLDNKNGRRVSLAGAQNKLPVTIINNDIYLVSENPSTHILKPEPENNDYNQLVYNEFFCMTLSKRVGINTANVKLIEVYNSEGVESDCLSVERYDRIETNSEILKIHQEDFCQLKGKLSSKKYDAGAGLDFFDLIAFIRDNCKNPNEDLNHILRLYIFNLIIGNRDAHAKNISFLYDDNGKLSLAPAYDLVCTEVFDNLSRDITMPINGKKAINKLDEQDLMIMAQRLEVSYEYIIQSISLIIEDLESQSQQILHELEDMDLYLDSIKHIKCIIAIIKDNSRMLTNILNSSVQ